MKKNFKPFVFNFCIIMTAALFFLSACGKKELSHDEIDVSKDAKTLYAQANDALNKEEYKKAAALFSKVTYEFPYYHLANKAHIMAIYSNYLLEDYDSVIFSVENYVKTHPISKYTPYTYYMKAISYYAQIELPQRDQTMTDEAKQAFTELISRFPKSSYIKDAKAKLALIDDHLAAHEMVVGRYYLNKEEMPGAIERFKRVVSNYSTTSQVEEALSRLVEAYLFLGLRDEAKKNAAVLGHNYPGSRWYKYSYNLIQSSAKKK
jgi:outer membrane protein assembly factor BamD